VFKQSKTSDKVKILIKTILVKLEERFKPPTSSMSWKRASLQWFSEGIASPIRFKS